MGKRNEKKGRSLFLISNDAPAAVLLTALPLAPLGACEEGKIAFSHRDPTALLEAFPWDAENDERFRIPDGSI